MTPFDLAHVVTNVVLMPWLLLDVTTFGVGGTKRMTLQMEPISNEWNRGDDTLLDLSGIVEASRADQRRAHLFAEARGYFTSLSLGGFSPGRSVIYEVSYVKIVII